MSYFSYLLQFNIYLALYFVFYKIFLCRETFFTLNRFFLLGGIFCAFILPFIRFHNWPVPITDHSAPYRIMTVLQQVVLPPATIARHVDTGWSLFSIVKIIYCAGIIVAGLLFVKRAGFIYHLVRKHPRRREQGHWRVDVPNGQTAFSFGPFLFAPDGTATDIYLHERVHIRQKHSLDILLLELIKLFCWFNPLVYLYQRTLKMVHEYIADQMVIRIVDKSLYAHLLVSQSFDVDTPLLIHSFFNRSQIKKRLLMLQETKSRKAAIWKYALSLPLFVLLLGISSSAFALHDKISKSLESLSSFAIAMEHGISLTGKVVNGEGEPLAGVTVLVVGSRGGTTTDQSGKYALKNLPGNTLLKFSCIGYTTQTVPVNSHSKINIVLHEEPFNIRKVVIRGYDSKNDKAASAAQKSTEPVFTFVEQMPSFPGGDKELMKYIKEHIRYPKEAKEHHISGTVIVTFTVKKDGGIGNIQTRNLPLGGGLEEEATRLVKGMPVWKPGMQNGQKVAVLYSLPMQFVLE